MRLVGDEISITSSTVASGGNPTGARMGRCLLRNDVGRSRFAVPLTFVIVQHRIEFMPVMPCSMIAMPDRATR